MAPSIRAHELESRIGRALVAGEVTEGANLRVDVRDGQLAVDIENPKGLEAGAEVGAG